MNSLRVFSHRALTFVMLLVATLVVAQEKYIETFKVGDDLVISVNTSHTDVVFETWNKDKVEVEAFIEGKDLSKEDKIKIFKNWNLDVLGNSKKIVITSNKGSLWSGVETLPSIEGLEGLENLEINLEGLKGLEGLNILEGLGDLNFNISVPEIPNFRDIPKWPFSDKQANVFSGKNKKYHSVHINFDTDEYEKNKKAYVAKLNKKYDTNVSVREVDQWLEELDEWSSEFEGVMEEWGENFGKEFELNFGPEFEEKMEKWGEEFGKSMEEWGENFGKELEEKMAKWEESYGEDIEKWAEQLEENVEKWAEDFEENYNEEDGNTIFYKNSNHKKIKKKIIIRMPKGTKTEVNVRYGELKMADAYNINATLNYASLIANSIDGGKSLINASYAPVSVNNWINGDLQLKFVDDCRLNNVKNINLHANTSNVNINLLEENGFLSGSFGSLFVNKVSNNFKAIDIVLENTDATIKIPSTSFSFHYNGKKSKLSTPLDLQLKKTTNGNRVLQKGYFNNPNSEKSFTIHATYSNVVIK